MADCPLRSVLFGRMARLVKAWRRTRRERSMRMLRSAASLAVAAVLFLVAPVLAQVRSSPVHEPAPTQTPPQAPTPTPTRVEADTTDIMARGVVGVMDAQAPITLIARGGDIRAFTLLASSLQPDDASAEPIWPDQ